MFFLYQIILSIILLISPIIIVLRIFRNKEDKIRFTEKFAIPSKKRKRGLLIWFHGSSVGEILSIIPLIKYYEKKKSVDQILITSSTLSSSKVLERFKGQDLPMYTKNTINNWDDLLIELDNVRSRGYAVDNEELEIGLTCVAAPILDKENNVIAAISISGPTSRIKSDNFDTIVNEVKNTAWKISNLLK